MKKQLGKSSTQENVVNILSVGLVDEEYASLKRMVSQPEWTVDTNSTWAVQRSPTLDSALSALRQGPIPIVVCEKDLRPGSWTDVLERIAAYPDPPLLIVSSRLADEHLWAEALNLGAYDVLEEPFYSEELSRVVRSAWLNWKQRHQPVFQSLRAAS